MKAVEVPVTFTGTVIVYVPDELSTAHANLLGQKIGLATVLATIENPDCEEALVGACYEFEEESGLDEAARVFDAAQVAVVSGVWTNTPKEEP